MILLLQVWEMERDGEKKRGNWVAAVSPRQSGAKKEEPAPEPEVEDEDIPV
ncbi:hypothetical protein D3C84_1297310 [compost metagenome]